MLSDFVAERLYAIPVIPVSAWPWPSLIPPAPDLKGFLLPKKVNSNSLTWWPRTSLLCPQSPVPHSPAHHPYIPKLNCVWPSMFSAWPWLCQFSLFPLPGLSLRSGVYCPYPSIWSGEGLLWPIEYGRRDAMLALDSCRLNHQVSSLTSLLGRSHGESLSLHGEGKAPLSSASKPSMPRCQACWGKPSRNLQTI